MIGKPPSSQSFTIQYNGMVSQLVVDVGISDAFDPNSGAPPPHVSSFKSIWDTGATNSVITNNVVRALGIKPTGMTVAQTVGGQKIVATYLVNIILPNKVAFVAVRVTEGSLRAGEDVLIGMDIIRMGDFSVTNTENRTCMSFRVPSCRKIDYVAQSKNAPPPRKMLGMDELRKLRNRNKRERKKAR